jgi:hypothetical protein
MFQYFNDDFVALNWQIYYDSDTIQQAQQQMSHHYDLLDVNIVLSLQAMLRIIFTLRHSLLHMNVSLELQIFPFV